MEYNDEYPACARTYATLRIYPKSLRPDDVSMILGIAPTRVSFAGDGSLGKHVNGWFLSTKNRIQSRDTRRHIDWLLDQVETVQDKIHDLRKEESKIDIACFWESTSGNGGPTISPHQMKRLVQFDIEVWWDVWFEIGE
jgi:hypothetical protein